MRMELSKLRQDGTTRVHLRMKMYNYAKELLEDHYDKDIGMSLGIRIFVRTPSCL